MVKPSSVNLMLAKTVRAVFVLTVMVLSLAILANSMTKPISRDEQMYCTSGVLTAQGKMIYRDFSYVAQMPYHPLLYAALFKISNTNHYLLVGRGVSVLCDILVMMCIVVIYRHIFGSFAISGTLFGLAGAILYVFNPLVDYANGYAWNNDVVVFYVVLSFWLFMSTDFKQKSKYWRIAAIGALLTLATCMRTTTALVQFLFFAVLLSHAAGSVKQRFKVTLPFLIASSIVLIWPVWVIAHAQRAFFLDVFSIHMLNSEWLHKIGMVHNKFDLAYSCLTTPGYFALIAIAVYLCVVLVWQRHRLTIPNKSNLLLAALLPLTFFIIALGLPTIWRQYLAMPVPFLIISFAFPLLYLREFADRAVGNKNFWVACALIAVCVPVAVVWQPVVLQRMPMLLTPENWVPIQLHKISEDIAGRTKEPKLILTLAPLYALEGGCDIYTEFSAGSFVYRVADFMSLYDRAVTHTVGSKTLEALLEKSPPSAVIVSVEQKYFSFLEEPFQAAVKPDWQRKVYDNGLIVYFKP